jgi:hypothetical protein
MEGNIYIYRHKYKKFVDLICLFLCVCVCGEMSLGGKYVFRKWKYMYVKAFIFLQYIICINFFLGEECGVLKINYCLFGGFVTVQIMVHILINCIIASMFRSNHAEIEKITFFFLSSNCLIFLHSIQYFRI